MSENHLNNCSTPLVNSKMQIKTTLRFYLISIRMAKINNTSQFMLSRMWSKGNTPPVLLVVQTCVATMEINMTVPHEDGN